MKVGDKVKMGIQLDSRYQKEAYDKIQESMKKNKKAGIVLPMGTGKTYLALKLIEDNLDKEQILYVSPSPTINVEVRKLIEEVYSAEEANKILSKVQFTTYCALNNQYKKKEMNYKADIIVLDEVHRSGAEQYGKAVDYLLENNKEANILGMTATPIRTDGRNMIKERFGETAYELTISEAVARGILKLPIYITSQYIFKEDIEDIEEAIKIVNDEDLKKELEEKLEKVRRQTENADGLKDIINKYVEKNGKYLVFCNPGEDVNEIIKNATDEGWFDGVNKNQTLLGMQAKNSDEENDIALRKFERRSKGLKVLFSKNMLNEGIHNEEIKGELMMRPTQSYILFVQQLGRVLSSSKEEPSVVLDLVNNIHYFQKFKSEIQQKIKKGEGRGDNRYNPKVLEQFKIIENQEKFIDIFREIEQGIKENIGKSPIDKTLDIVRILKLNGVDISNLTLSKYENYKQHYFSLKEIQPKGVDINQIIEENNLDGDFQLATNIYKLRYLFNEGYSTDITRDQMKLVEEYGIIKETPSTKTLRISKILQEERC